MTSAPRADGADQPSALTLARRGVGPLSLYLILASVAVSASARGELVSGSGQHSGLVSMRAMALLVSIAAAFGLMWRGWRVRAHRKEAELGAALRERDERLRLAVASARHGLWDLNVTTGQMVTSPEYAQLLGLDPADFRETLEAFKARLHPDDRDRWAQHFDRFVASGGTPCETEFRQRRQDGSWVWIQSVGRVVERTDDGRASRMLGIHTDIDARKRAELRQQRLANCYAALSRTNQLIARATSEEGLLTQVCEAAVTLGGVTMAWVGMTEPATGRLRPVAARGRGTAYLDGITISTRPDDEFGNGPSGSAVRGNRPVWIDEFKTSTNTTPWHDRAEPFGWLSSGALPLVRGGAAVGALTLYADTPDAFDPDVRRLLIDLAADISFALDGFAREAARTAAERQLREQDQLLSASQRMAHIGSWSARADGSGVWSNEMHRIFGRPPEQGAPTLEQFAALLHPEDRPRVVREIQQLAVVGTGDLHVAPSNTEYRTILPDGRVRYMRAHVEVAHDPDGSARLVGMTQDVTEQHDAEQSLKHSQERLHLALAATGQWMWDADVRSGVVTLSTAADESVAGDGASLWTVRQMPYMSLVHPDDSGRVGSLVKRTLAAGNDSVDEQFRLTDSPDENRWVHVLGRVVERDGDGLPARAAGIMTDITDRRQAEEALNIKDRAIESAVSAMAIAGLDGRITYTNRAFLDLWGYAETNEVLGRHTNDFWVNTDVNLQVAQAVAATGRWAGTMEALRKDGSAVTVLVSASLVSDASGAPLCLLASFVDITERIRAEEKLEQSLRDKEALLQEVHHRVKNNLQVVSSLLRLESSRRADPAVKAALAEMQNRIVSMALLHETLYRSNDFTHVNLANYLTQLANHLFRSLAPSNGRINLRLTLGAVTVDLDQAVTCGLLVNELLSNSLKHAFPGDHHGDISVLLDLIPGGSHVRLVVRDDGVGLPPGLDLHQTSSLGLQLIFDLSRQLRGTIDVVRSPGASFSIDFVPRTPRTGVLVAEQALS